MKFSGHTFRLALVGAAVAAMPAATASASTSGTESVSALAERAAELATEEQTLLAISAGELDSVRRAEIEARISTVDAEGADLLVQLDRLDVELTQAIRIALEPLAPVAERTEQPGLFVPGDAVYAAASSDLMRIASTPGAVTNVPGRSSSPAFGLLAVASLSLLALGAAALGNSLRRRPEAHELEAVAWSDGLTGLANRRRLDHDVARHDDNERPTAAIMVDIDHFSDINDTFGYAFGDEILRKVGDAISKQIRYNDVVYRYGGEEFCVLLPGAAAHDAVDVAERIVRAARAVELPNGGHVTVSVGVTETPTGASEAVYRADQALSSAKQSGRDRAVASEQQPTVAV